VPGGGAVVRYVDTSVLVPYYIPEARSAEANALVMRGGETSVSDISLAEFYVVVARKVREGVLTREAADKARALFEDHLLSGLYQRLPFRSSLVEEVRDMAWSSSVHLRTLDALHVVMAAQHGAEVITFDDRVAKAARAFGLVVSP
jgi:predicted nucleic acid-binding protein